MNEMKTNVYYQLGGYQNTLQVSVIWQTSFFGKSFCPAFPQMRRDLASERDEINDRGGTTYKDPYSHHCRYPTRALYACFKLQMVKTKDVDIKKLYQVM